MAVAVLGPQKSYSHLVAQKRFPSEDLQFYPSITAVFEKVATLGVLSGIIPLENVLQGSVRESLLAFKKYNLQITEVIRAPIHHCIAAQANTFTKIASHPQALGQCASFLQSYREKGYEVRETASTSAAMELAAQDPAYAAIGPIPAAEEYHLCILKQMIEDNPENVTLFGIITPTSDTHLVPHPGAKCSLILSPQADRPGLLHTLLGIIARKGINLTKIESLPTAKRLGEYDFYLEVEPCQDHLAWEGILAELREHVKIKLLGMYQTTALDL